MVKGAFEAALSFSSFLLKVLDPLFHGGGAEKPVPSMIYSVPRHPRASSREGQGDVEKILVPSPRGCGLSLSLPSPRAGRSPGLGNHGAAGGVRSPARAAGGLGFPRRGKRASLGPWTLQFLYAISGARPPPGNAGLGCKRTPGRRGRRGREWRVCLETAQRRRRAEGGILQARRATSRAQPGNQGLSV